MNRNAWVLALVVVALLFLVAQMRSEIHQLRQELANQETVVAQKAASDITAKTDQEDMLELIRVVCDKELNPELRAKVAALLASRNEPVIFFVLDAISRDNGDHPLVRGAAIRGIGRKGQVEQIRSLKKIKDPILADAVKIAIEQIQSRAR